MTFLSTPSARRATRTADGAVRPIQISIHALREEGDRAAGVQNVQYFAFLSTPSARRATCAPLRRILTSLYFYPRPPRGGRPALRFHSPPSVSFLSTPSARRATRMRMLSKLALSISIHALREEGDSQWASTLSKTGDFYPRPPRGGRRSSYRSYGTALQFLSTPSARRATRAEAAPRSGWHISIHALREEGDGGHPVRRPAGSNFYPRPPRGGRPSILRCG